MMGRKRKLAAAWLLCACILSACAAQGQEKGSGQGADVPSDSDGMSAASFDGSRPSLMKNEATGDIDSAVPCVEAYTIEPDWSNIDNLEQFYLEGEKEEKLRKNGFVVEGNAGREFFEIYEMNRYSQIPNFVTVDSLMHTYHLYFTHLLKNIERNYLSDSIMQLSRKMLEGSMAQYDQLKGSEWESAAKRNVAFFTVGAKLLEDSVQVNAYVEDMVEHELGSIRQADGIYKSEITESEEDYTQYIPRGYYEGDKKLEQYFKAMMWYGRIHFLQREEDMDRSALLITQALAHDAEAYELWKSVYAVTSFFAGASDDMGVCEYAPAIQEAYGNIPSMDELAGNRDAFERFHAITASLSVPQINSIPICQGESNVVLGFRFMGQRFTIDGAIMQQLIYSNVGENGAGLCRMLPDVLDVPAALGSDMALRILEERGAADYAGYSENMNQLREDLAQDNAALWTASLYANWLNTLRPLLDAKGEGYPMFMQSEEWLKKDLECFAGSFTELKHDTILYSKQVIAEMGGDYNEVDDRGYVEPEPLVYARFARLADLTAQGLKEYGMLSSTDEENLSRLAYIANQLLDISNKELRDEVLTGEEYDFIESYGGNLEHFWFEAVKGENGSGNIISSQEYPAAIVVDIAADPEGEALEAATGNPSAIYVVVKVDGKLKIARGSVYSFYQFTWPLEDRLTDSKWRQMMGLQADEEGNYNYDWPVEKPDWTDSYRYEYVWE